jgi:hypothetical protein
MGDLAHRADSPRPASGLRGKEVTVVADGTGWITGSVAGAEESDAGGVAA